MLEKRIQRHIKGLQVVSEDEDSITVYTGDGTCYSGNFETYDKKNEFGSKEKDVNHKGCFLFSLIFLTFVTIPPVLIGMKIYEGINRYKTEEREDNYDSIGSNRMDLNRYKF